VGSSSSRRSSSSSLNSTITMVSGWWSEADDRAAHPESISLCGPREEARGGGQDEHCARVADPSAAQAGTAGVGRSCSVSVQRRRAGRGRGVPARLGQRS
jgi:hypothetical protein